MNDHLDKLLEKVADQRSFLAFIGALSCDFAAGLEAEAIRPSSPYGPNASGWENVTVHGFLEAAQAWGADTLARGEPDSSEINPWRRCAEILYAGKFYE